MLPRWILPPLLMVGAGAPSSERSAATATTRESKRVVTEQGYRIELDRSWQVLRLHAPEDRGGPGSESQISATPELEALFQQDRMLQSPLQAPGSVEALARALERDPASAAAYGAYLELVSRLTNPLAGTDLRTVMGARGRPNGPRPGSVAFLPPSVAHETELVKRLYGDQPIPEGFDLAHEMIGRIRSGQLSVAPTAASGWYDHQTWSLEPLVVPDRMPEAARLRLGEDYAQLLLELFKGLLTLTRESHVKQLEQPMVTRSAPSTARQEPILIAPGLTVEPLATHYLRRALAYAFVREVLARSFGHGALGTMRRRTADGPVEASLDDELRQMQSLCFGAYLTACRELGMPHDAPAAAGSGAGADADAAQLVRWRLEIERDADLGRDARAMVPVFYDLERRKIKVWVMLGWADRPVSVSFDTPPLARVLHEATGRVALRHPELRFVGETHRSAYPVMAEVYVTRVLDRDEFRRLCDTHKTRAQILARLE